MSSTLVDKVTHKVRPDHTHWDCDICDEVNILKDEICVKCNESRLGQSRALTYTKEPIGKNCGLDDQDRETWEYYLFTNGNH
ncbi:unnamed protein product [Fusarium graminearum]|nr:unnamed protein product [Fusarium graminearum]